ncbi:MAG: transposase, partial [Thermoplasmata archaeon]|nr:transposase [Thermoplasmata archaeon]
MANSSRKQNPENDIIVIWDNARVHWSRKVRVTAEKLGIKLVYLPPYSPDLNPLHFIWMRNKSPKRVTPPNPHHAL